MATTITGKLNKPARGFQAGTYTGFGVNVGKQYYDTETKSKQWTNYEAAFFVSNNNSQSKMDFMRSVLVEGAVIEITAKSEKPKLFEGNNGPVLSIQLLECDLGYVHTSQQSSAQQQAPQQAPQQQPQYAQQAPQQQQQQPYPPYNGGQQQQAPQNQMGYQQNPK